MMECMVMINEMVLEHIIGLVVKNIWDYGKMVCNMGMERL